MSQVIVYQQNDGSAAVVYPTGELDIAQVALKDIPFGKSYKIVDESVLPPVDEFFPAWIPDMTNPDGTGMGAQRWFISKYDTAMADASQAIADLTTSLNELAAPDESNEQAVATHAQTVADINGHIVHLNNVISELAAMRKIQTDELFKFEGVQL